MNMKFFLNSGRIVLLFLLMLFANPIKAQLNENKVKKELGNLEVLIQKGRFEEGRLFTKDDTIAMKFLVFNKAKRANNFLFCIAKTRKGDIVVYRPREIRGFSIRNEVYFSHQTAGEYYFVKQLTTGKVHLYERHAVPSDNRNLYYLKFPHEKDYIVIDVRAEDIVSSESQLNMFFSGLAPGSTVSNTESKNKFKQFTTLYFGDCKAVVNAVNADFYSIADIQAIVETYNECL